MSSISTRTDSLVITPNSGTTVAFVPQLFCILEAGHPLRPASRHVLDGLTEVRFGRGSRRVHERTRHGESALLTISIPDRWLSARHAELRRTDHGYVFHDRGSKNGSKINGAPVESATLEDGDVIELGQTFFMYRERGAYLEAEPRDFMISADQTLLGLGTLHSLLNAQFSDLGRISASDLPVAILGETGTGKELAARAVHEMSRRRGNFVAINCGAIPKDLAPSEFFGYARGAFSGAHNEKLGLITAADGGTLFLDEIGDLPLEQQAVLLRVLQDHAVHPIGAISPRKVDFRLVVATHRDISRALGPDRFREDLWARVSGFVLQLPPLRDRREDLGLIMGGVLLRERGPIGAEITIRSDAAHVLLRHAWPRNIRELEQGLRAALALCKDDTITLGDLPEGIRSPPTPTPTPMAAHAHDHDVNEDPAEALSERRQAHLQKMLERNSGNISEVARLMGKARSQIQRWIKRYNIDVERYRSS
jgi:sigma-54 dependent transcriptional regulator, acetoin dehydrogenase operon transcriptional activator AcoR